MQYLLSYFSTLIILLFVSCVSHKSSLSETNVNNNYKTHDIQKIELTEQTRGTNRVFTFIPNSKMISTNGNVITSPLSVSDWESITKEVSSIDLLNMSNLPSPTTDRYSDAALASKIIITFKNKTYQSSEFDANRPPAELENLYKKLKKTVIRY